MPVSFRGLLKGSDFGKCKVLAKNTLARRMRERGRFFRQTEGLTLYLSKHGLPLPTKRKQGTPNFREQTGKNKNEGADITGKY
jgi:hypothetical protein